MDGCASHSDLLDPKGQVRVETYPPNSTSVHQPADMGIIAAMKLQYRSRLLNTRANTMSITSKLRTQAKERKLVAVEAGLAEGHNAHLLDACELVKSAWDVTTETTIVRFVFRTFVTVQYFFKCRLDKHNHVVRDQ